jgi:hypothetical protein
MNIYFHETDLGAKAVTLISYHQQYQHGNQRKLSGGVTLNAI